MQKVDATKKQTLKETMRKALTKLKLEHERDLRKYLPDQHNCEMHHLTLRKLEKESPKKLQSMIEERILNVEKPKALPRKERKRKKTSAQLQTNGLNTEDLTELLNLAEEHGNHQLAERIRKQLPFKTLQKEMLEMVRSGKADATLWNAYQKAVKR